MTRRTAINPRNQIPQQQRTRINDQIRTPMVRVVHDGRQLGVMSSREARDKANFLGLDLVEIAPTANPPVCHIMDFGKFKFDQNKAKKEQKNNSKSFEMKEVQFRPNIGEHDLETKIKSLKQFLTEGRIVQVTVIFSKRGLMFKDQGFQVIAKITQSVVGIGTPEKAPSFNEKRLSVRFKPVIKEA